MPWLDLVPTLVGVAALMAVTTGVLMASGVGHRWAPLAAVARGLVQLAAISVILTGVISSPAWVGVALAVMLTVAVITASRRIGMGLDGVWMVGASMLVGIVVTLAIVFGTGAIELSPRYALAIGGIVIGNAMTIATLAGRGFITSTRDRWSEVEGWMALGATPRESTSTLTRDAVAAALIPSIDQTKTTGLVTLPGAFVGAIFGGVSPLEAGRFQIVVLAAIMCAGALTAIALVRLLAPVRVQPVLPS